MANRNNSDLIILTGANGFIGCEMLRELNKVGYNNIIASDWVDLSSRNLLKGTQYLRFIPAQELFKNLDAIAQEKRPAWFLHIGANSSTTETNRKLLEEMNTDYSKRVFDWCTERGVPLIYASSAATYGAGENGYSDETPSSKLKALNLYGESKLLFDHWVEERVSKAAKTPPHWYGLKYFNVYGPNEGHKNEMASLVYKAYHQILATGQLKLFRSHRPDFKDGEQMRDFIYVKQVTQWMLELMEGKAVNGIYNFGMGKAETWIHLAECIFKALDRPTKIEFIDMPLSIRDQYQYFTEANMKKSFTAGQLSKPIWSMERSIQDYVGWLKNS